jgi:hypothetical protein
MYGEDASSGSDDILVLFENTSVTKLDMKRMYRYLDKTVKKETAVAVLEEEEQEEEYGGENEEFSE